MCITSIGLHIPEILVSTSSFSLRQLYRLCANVWLSVNNLLFCQWSCQLIFWHLPVSSYFELTITCRLTQENICFYDVSIIHSFALFVDVFQLVWRCISLHILWCSLQRSSIVSHMFFVLFLIIFRGNYSIDIAGVRKHWERQGFDFWQKFLSI